VHLELLSAAALAGIAEPGARGPVGPAVGLAVSTKLSALPFIGMGLAAVRAHLLRFARAPRSPLGRRVGVP